MATSNPKNCSHNCGNGACKGVASPEFEGSEAPLGPGAEALLTLEAIDEAAAMIGNEPSDRFAARQSQIIQFGAPLRDQLGRLRCALTVDDYMSALGRAHSRRIV